MDTPTVPGDDAMRISSTSSSSAGSGPILGVDTVTLTLPSLAESAVPTRSPETLTVGFALLGDTPKRPRTGRSTTGGELMSVTSTDKATAARGDATTAPASAAVAACRCNVVGKAR